MVVHDVEFTASKEKLNNLTEAFLSGSDPTRTHWLYLSGMTTTPPGTFYQSSKVLQFSWWVTLTQRNGPERIVNHGTSDYEARDPWKSSPWTSGKNRANQLVRLLILWPGITHDIDTCEQCQRYRPHTLEMDLHTQIQLCCPMDQVCMDIALLDGYMMLIAMDY